MNRDQRELQPGYYQEENREFITWFAMGNKIAAGISRFLLQLATGTRSCKTIEQGPTFTDYSNLTTRPVILPGILFKLTAFPFFQ
jgi:hypothetical protein